VVSKLVSRHGGLRPLRLAGLTVAAGEIVSVRGFDAVQAETVVGLVTGAILPDDGEVVIFGEPTTAVSTPDQWLASLDRIGLVSARAPLLAELSVGQNIAVPLTLDLDPLPAPTRDDVRRLASDAGVDDRDLDRRAGDVGTAVRIRTHLARALALKPLVLLLEHASASLDRADAAAFGQIVSRIARSAGLSVLALTSDDRFAAALGGRRMSWQAASGDVLRVRGWARWF
jgi:putative ABC transport system ATP-binding protein